MAEGGCITTNNKSLNKIRLLLNHSMERKNYKIKLQEISHVPGIIKFQILDGIIEQVR